MERIHRMAYKKKNLIKIPFRFIRETDTSLMFPLSFSFQLGSGKALKVTSTYVISYVGRKWN